MSMTFPFRGSAPKPEVPRVIPETLTAVCPDESSACCCPARPAVRVIMLPSTVRPHTTDLLLCGHHYRASHAALEAAHATVHDLDGQSADAPAGLVEDPARVA